MERRSSHSGSRADGVSQSLREKGNAVFRSVTSDQSPLVREARLLEAIQLYYRASETAQTEEESSSAAKNHAVATWKLAVVYAVMDNRNIDIKFHYYKLTLKFFAKAKEAGGTSQSLEWNQKLSTNFRDCISEILQEAVESTNGEKRVHVIHELLPYLNVNEYKVEVFLHLGRANFSASVDLLEALKFKEALHFLKECYYPLEEMKGLSAGSCSHMLDALVLEEDVRLQTCIAESMQARFAGKNTKCAEFRRLLDKCKLFTKIS